MSKKSARTYSIRAAAKDRVKTAESAVDAAGVKLAHRDRELNAAIDTLAENLIADGHPAENPFALYGGPTPATLKSLPMAEKARRVKALAAEVLRPRPVG